MFLFVQMSCVQQTKSALFIVGIFTRSVVVRIKCTKIKSQQPLKSGSPLPEQVRQKTCGRVFQLITKLIYKETCLHILKKQLLGLNIAVEKKTFLKTFQRHLKRTRRTQKRK